jgi:hypothetical protein
MQIAWRLIAPVAPFVASRRKAVLVAMRIALISTCVIRVNEAKLLY